MGTGELLGKPNKLRGVTCNGLASHPEGVEILLAASCHGNQDKLWPDEPVLAPRHHSHCTHFEKTIKINFKPPFYHVLIKHVFTYLSCGMSMA